MATASNFRLSEPHRCVRGPQVTVRYRDRCRQVACSTGTGSAKIQQLGAVSECSDDSPSSLGQRPAELCRAGLLAPLAAFVKANLALLNVLVTLYPFPFYFLMAFFPRSQLTKFLLTSARCLIPLAVMYAVLLCTSWTPESASLLFPGDMETALSEMMAGKPGLYFVPTIEGICKLLSAPMASVSAWAHLQFIAFFCARYIWMDGLVKQVATVHSVLMCTIMPPLGFLSHIFTCFFIRTRRSGNKASPSQWPAPSPAADQGWAVSTGGSGFYTTNRSDLELDGRQGASPEPGADRDASGPSSNGATQSMQRTHAMTRRGVAWAGGSLGNEGNQGQPPANSDRQSHGKNPNMSDQGAQPSNWLTVLEPEYVDRSDEK